MSPTMSLSARVRAAAAAWFACLTSGFISLYVIWLINEKKYAGMLGFPDFVSGTIGDALLLPATVAGLIFLAKAAANAPTRSVIAGALVGLIAGTSVQLLWLFSTSGDRQWGVPERGSFSLPGAWHATFFVVVCSLVGAALARLTFGEHNSTTADSYVAHATSVSALAFATTVVYDSTRGVTDISSAVTAISTVGATLAAGSLILFKVSGLRQAVLGSAACLTAGVAIGLVLIELHQSGGSAYLVAHLLCFVGGYGLGLVQWTYSSAERRSRLPAPALPIAYGAMALSLPSLLIALGNQFDLPGRTPPLSPAIGMAVLGVGMVLLLLSSRGTGTEWARTVSDAAFLLATSTAAALASFDTASIRGQGWIMGGLSSAVLITTLAITPDFRRYARWEAEATEFFDGRVSEGPFQRCVRAARGANVCGTALRGLAALLIFLLALTVIAGDSRFAPVSGAQWTIRTSLAAALLAGISVTLVLIPFVMPTSRRTLYASLALPIAAAPAVLWLAMPTVVALPTLVKVFMALSCVQGLLLAVDAGQSWVGTGRWLRGLRFEGSEDWITAGLLGVGWVVFIPLEFALVYAGGSSMAVLLIVFAVLAAVRFPLAIAAGRLARLRGRNLASMDTGQGFVYDELFRWLIALLSIGAPALTLRALKEFQDRALEDYSVLGVMAPTILAATPLAVLAVALPHFCQTNYFYAKTQAETISKSIGLSGTPEFSGPFNHVTKFAQTWRSANRVGLPEGERFVTGLLAHIGVQNFFRSAAVLIQPLALLVLALELLAAFFASVYRLSAARDGAGSKVWFT